MNYRGNSKNEDRLSLLGYGCLRFPKKGGGIDQEKTERLLQMAYEGGVNYFDTAYIYPGSETALGKFLAKGYRDKVFVADKIPHYLVKKASDFDSFFDEMLKRLQTDYIDYFLLHMLNDVKSFHRLESLGVREWIQKQKEAGRIKRVGFSFHGTTEMYLQVLDAYDWDFTQVQYNYMDEHSQAGKKGVLAAYEKGISMIIMEPLRGGKLVQGLPESAKKMMEKESHHYSPAEWGLRWLYNQKEISVVLSGMNEEEQVTENMRIASEAEVGSMDEQQMEFIDKIRGEIRKYIKIPCTGCGYCQPCPAGVDIPSCFAAYNSKFTDGYITAMSEYLRCTTLKTTPTNAGLCMKCGKCETHCPQSLPIRDFLVDVKKGLEGPIYPIVAFVAKKVTRF